MSDVIGKNTIPAGSVPPNMATGVDETTSRPYTMAQMDVESLTQEFVDTNLQIQSTLSDPYVSNMADVIPTFDGKVQIPDAITARITADGGNRSVKLPVIDPLRGNPRAGTQEEQVGYEIGVKVRFIEAFYNEYSQAIGKLGYGVNFNHLQKLRIFDQSTPLISKYFQEIVGRWCREAGLQTVTYEMTKPGCGVAQHWNPNIVIANTDPFDQPAYNATLATMTANILTVMQGADTGTNGSYANLSIEFLDMIGTYAETKKRIRKIPVPGGEGYALVLPSTQVDLIASMTGALGNMWRDVSSFSNQEKMTFPGLVGMYKDLVIIRDPRFATVEADYSGGTITPTYVQPGNDDQRELRVYDASTNPTWSCGMLLGAGALLDWEPRALHYEDESGNYGKRLGMGAFGERGITLGIAKSDTKVANVENNSSIALFFTNGSSGQRRS